MGSLRGNGGRPAAIPILLKLNAAVGKVDPAGALGGLVPSFGTRVSGLSRLAAEAAFGRSIARDMTYPENGEA
jgi:hypothetical protein